MNGVFRTQHEFGEETNFIKWNIVKEQTNGLDLTRVISHDPNPSRVDNAADHLVNGTMRINSSRSKVSAIWIHRLGHSSIHLRHNEKKTGEITEQIHRIGAEGAFIRRVSVNTSPRQLNAAAAERTSVIVAVFDTLRPAATDFWWSLWPAPFDRYMC